jgi:hypothetical protein
MGTRAYLTHDSETALRVTVHEGCALYSDGTPNLDQSWVFAATDDGVDHLFGAQPERPFRDADRILAEHGWKREGSWMIGDAVTGTYARIART